MVLMVVLVQPVKPRGARKGEIRSLAVPTTANCITISPISVTCVKLKFWCTPDPNSMSSALRPCDWIGLEWRPPTFPNQVNDLYVYDVAVLRVPGK